MYPAQHVVVVIPDDEIQRRRRALFQLWQDPSTGDTLVPGGAADKAGDNPLCSP